jgi:hypothetical protein
VQLLKEGIEATRSRECSISRVTREKLVSVLRQASELRRCAFIKSEDL